MVWKFKTKTLKLFSIILVLYIFLSLTTGCTINDKNTQLLLALKPHFSERRRQKVDQAISMMRLMAMLPALKESGIFAGL